MKINKYIYLVVLSFLFASCENAIDIEQVGRLEPEVTFEDTDDLQQGLLGVYGGFDYTSQIQFNAVFTDEITIGPVNGGQGISDGSYSFRLDAASTAPAALWSRLNGRLNATTRLIEAGKLIRVREDDPLTVEDEVEEYQDVMGQAYALRAWAHFELLVYFSDDITDDASFGTIIVDFVPETFMQLPRNTTGEVFDAIEADLDLAEDFIEERSNATFVSRDFVKALRARMALYRGNYAEADELATELLADYSIANQTQYRAMFQDADNTEIIFKLERVERDGFSGQGATGSAAAGGRAGAIFAFSNVEDAYFQMSNSLFDLLQDGDVRRDVLLATESSIGDGEYLINKYRGSNSIQLMNDLKIFRAAEMLLIRAEVAVHNNDLVGAANFIDELIDARFGSDQTTPVYANQQEAFLRILQQRQLELAYEGHRWVDLRRLGPLTAFTRLIRDPRDCEVNSACSLPFADRRFQRLPIPISELNGNSNIQQNTGY